jgi:hypothetical protein
LRVERRIPVPSAQEDDMGQRNEGEGSKTARQ